MMKSKNWKKTSHKEEFIKAKNLKTGEVRIFKNGIQAAQALGCSHVLIYNAIAGKCANTAKGWSVEWVRRDNPECAEFLHQYELEMM